MFAELRGPADKYREIRAQREDLVRIMAPFATPIVAEEFPGYQQRQLKIITQVSLQLLAVEETGRTQDELKRKVPHVRGQHMTTIDPVTDPIRSLLERAGIDIGDRMNSDLGFPNDNNLVKIGQVVKILQERLHG